MKKSFTLLSLLCFLISRVSFAQGIKKETNDPFVARMEASEKSTAPFSVLFKEDAAYKATDAQLLFSKYLSLKTGIDELRLKKKDAAGDISVSRYQQYFKGLIVEHGNYMLTAKNEKASFITGDFFNIDEATSVLPVISEQEALAKAWQYMDGEQPATNDVAPAELVFTENNFLTKPDGKALLAYKFFISSHKKALRMEYVYVSAADGTILYTNTSVNTGCLKQDNLTGNRECAVVGDVQSVAAPEVLAGTAGTRYSGNVTNLQTSFVSGSYRLQTAVATEGSPTHVKNLNHAGVASFSTVAQFNTAMSAATEVTDADNNWTLAEYNNANYDNTALDAAWGAQRVYEYWSTRHGRASWDNANGVLNLYVHGDNNWNNAFWQGSGGINSMFYGDGSNVNGGFSTLTALDVTGHEIGHGVCQSTCNLTYSKESGGMNEGFSDIWGASIEHFADPHETDAVAKSYFDIGEEIGLPLPTPLRSLSNPKLHGQPDTYLGTNWVSTTTGTDVGGDNWGVHTNSGVLNHWFYFLVSGGTGVNDNGNSYAVPGIGWVDAEHITFLGEQNLTASSNYAACRTAMINAATTLFGACAIQTEAVIRAWYAVGVGANFVPCTAQVGFRDVALSISESAGTFSCPATKSINVRMMVEGPAPTGGNAIATVTATGTATNGKDYTIGTGTATFIAGSTADQNIIVNIIDDAEVESTETIKLDFTFNANGSNASKTNAYTQATISVIDNDTIPEAGNTIIANTIGAYNTTSNLTSPFKGATKGARSQFIWTAAELNAAGVRANVPFSAVSFNVVTKSSTIPYTGYTLALGNTTLTASTTAFASGLTTVYSGNYTTAAGTNLIPFSTAFTWNGTDNLVMQVCFANTAAGANDVVQGYTADAILYTGYATGTTAGCTMTAATTNTARPLPTFTQLIPPVEIETAASATRTQTTFTGGSNYYYSPAGKIIAGISGSNSDLGCVSAIISAAGTGFSPLPGAFSASQRSLKEITLTPATNGSTAAYTATIYFTDAELAGRTPASLLLVKTDAATDAQINGTNTVLVTPTVISGTNYKGFSGNFTGFSRFFLIDNAIILPVTGLIAEAYLLNGRINIKWKTQTESNSSHFETERSYDGVNFTKISEEPASVNSNTEKQYATIDADAPQNINYYRVKLVNINGSKITSPVVSVKMSGKAFIAVIPNPVHDQFAIQYNNNGKGIVTILDATGRKIKQFVAGGTSGSIAVDGANFASGVYIVTLTDEKGQTITQKFLKQ